MKWNLTQRLIAVFAALLVTCCGVLTWIQFAQSEQTEQSLTQRLSYKLAQHIAANSELIGQKGLSPEGLKDLLHMLMVVNPSIEVYLLDMDGRVAAHLAPPGRVKLTHVSLQPVREYLRGAPLPILGDDPRHPEQPNVFSVAPLTQGGVTRGYVYVVLLGEDHAALAANNVAHRAWTSTLVALTLVLMGGVFAGVAAFRWVTRPLRDLTATVQEVERKGVEQLALSDALQQVESHHPEADEVGCLRSAFQSMSARLVLRWQALLKKDEQRREVVANISHDLRTPLMALHGYLETLAVKDQQLSAEERQRYLARALAQSRKVGRLAQELFELARLEYGGIRLEKERFLLTDLIQDVFQKFELVAQEKQVRLVANLPETVPSVEADLGLMERVLTNLLDNALRHSPNQGMVRVSVATRSGQVTVTVEDEGEGIPAERRQDLFHRPSVLSGNPPAQRGGLGLLIVQKIVQLHDGVVEFLDQQDRQGAAFMFALPL
ncbi:MAG: HAMP domain-containing histidine kinase [Burkholderiales bacterium]|nr:HAMP domain-containing histidine kinase [Burkholderiales bacterium]